MPQRNRHAKNKEKRKQKTGHSSLHHNRNNTMPIESLPGSNNENMEPSNMHMVDIDLSNPMGGEEGVGVDASGKMQFSETYFAWFETFVRSRS